MILNRTQPKKQQTAKLDISNEKVFEAVRKRAYELYCKRGYQHGSDFSDWVEAEKQVKKEMGLTR